MTTTTKTEPASPTDLATVYTSVAEPRSGLVARWCVRLISGYQVARSGRISPCRFYPSCSAYGIEAITTHGSLRGMLLTARRILRCRPGGPSGIDLVPSSSSKVHTHA